MKILHIIREKKDRWPLELAASQRTAGHDVALLLLHDAVLASAPSDFKTFACHDDVIARAARPEAELVDYDAIVRLLFEYDTVSCW